MYNLLLYNKRDLVSCLKWIKFYSGKQRVKEICFEKGTYVVRWTLHRNFLQFSLSVECFDNPLLIILNVFFFSHIYVHVLTCSYTTECGRLEISNRFLSNSHVNRGDRFALRKIDSWYRVICIFSYTQNNTLLCSFPSSFMKSPPNFLIVEFQLLLNIRDLGNVSVSLSPI